jgi:hypothetical protein
MDTDTTPRYRKIQPGLYGTNIHREPCGSIGYERPATIEVVIDRMGNGWWIREMTPDLDLTDNCGEAFYTLRDAKEYITHCTTNNRFI